MDKKIKKPELLMPAGSLPVLKVAVNYGADAVYIGGEAFSLRANAHNFSLEDMKEGIDYAHKASVKVYVTVNILAHNDDLKEAEKYFKELKELRPDALIISDPGIFMLARRIVPEIDIHISTQANNTNYASFKFWYDLKASRVVSARELSLREIKELRDNIPEDMEIESFVHGAMCISYSGRCLLSAYMTGRSGNMGDCTHPCRWKYKLLESCDDSFSEDMSPVAIEEDTRPGQYMPVYENERGTYIFNSKDLCMIEHIPEMIEAGIDSFKVEGRMKSALYVASVARTYRMAIDDYFKDPEIYRSRLEFYRQEISKCTYREYTTAFFFGKPSEESQIYDANTYIKEWIYLGIIDENKKYEADNGHIYYQLEQKNKFCVSDTVEVMKTDGRNIEAKVTDMLDEELKHIDSCPHPLQKFYVDLGLELDSFDIIRCRK